MIDAFILYKNETQTDLNLVIAGKKGWHFHLIKRKINSSIYKKHLHFINYIQPNDKVVLYNIAKALFFPSFYEGFGLPPLEAAACGTPIVCGSNSSLPEIFGNTDLYIDPYNLQSIKEAIRQVQNPNVSLIYSQKGQSLAQNYSWEKTATEYLNLI